MYAAHRFGLCVGLPGRLDLPERRLGLETCHGYRPWHHCVCTYTPRVNESALTRNVFQYSWTIHFDTIYGLQDKEDDLKAGVYSCALLFGSYVRPILSFFAAFFVGTLAYAGYLNHQGVFYYVISVGCTALHVVWQLATPDLVANGGKIWKVSQRGRWVSHQICAPLLMDHAVLKVGGAGGARWGASKAARR